MDNSGYITVGLSLAAIVVGGMVLNNMNQKKLSNEEKSSSEEVKSKEVSTRAKKVGRRPSGVGIDTWRVVQDLQAKCDESKVCVKSDKKLVLLFLLDGNFV